MNSVCEGLKARELGLSGEVFGDTNINTTAGDLDGRYILKCHKNMLSLDFTLNAMKSHRTQVLRGAWLVG